MTGPGPLAVARVLVALDLRSSRDDAVPATVSLAARIGADVDALFVEDIDLLRAAGLPAATELSLPDATFRPLDRRAVEAQLAAIATAARNAVASAARAHRLAWTFRVARGRLADELLAASARSDLVIVGRRTRALAVGRSERMRAARTVARQARSPVLLLGQDERTGRGAVVVDDGSTPAPLARALAALLVEPGAAVTVLLVARTASEAERLAKRARAEAPDGLALTVRWAGGTQVKHVVLAARGSRALLAIDAESPVLQGDGLEILLEQLDSPVLVAR